MQKTKYLLLLFCLVVFVACSDEDEREQNIRFCVSGVWHNGRDTREQGREACRMRSTTDLLEETTGDLVIATADYPASIDVHCSDGTDFTMTKGSGICSAHGEYWQYTPSVIYKDKKIIRENLTFSATATIDDGNDALTGTATFANLDGNHLQFILHHTKALLRFAFKVSADYDKVRYIRVTGLEFNGNDCAVVDQVLSTDNKYIAYAYIDPSVILTSYTNTLRCTYNIYEKDGPTDGHLTRKGVTATNTFKLSTLKDESSNPIVTIRAGYYYDLKVTLDPTYLGVLSEHDNKHLTVE